MFLSPRGGKYNKDDKETKTYHTAIHLSMYNRFFFFTLNTSEEKKIFIILSALMINIVTLFFVISLLLLSSALYKYDYLHVQCRGHHYRVVRSALRRRWWLKFRRSISKYSLEHTYVSRNTSLSRGLMSRPSRNSRIQTRTKIRGHEEDNVSVTFRTETIDQFWDKYGSVELQFAPPAPIQIAFSII